jgi:5-methylcytosine-specific restriction endonuclease McrA
VSAVLEAPVLALNKHYAPLRVIDVRRAVSLLVTGSAEVVDVEPEQRGFATYDFSTWRELSELKLELERERYKWLGLVRGQLAAPSIVRLTKFERHRRARVPLSRRNIYFRDGNVCQYCGKRFPTSELSLDHVQPRSRGGGDTWENLVCACTWCNAKKADKTPAEAGMRLIRTPKIVKAAAQLIRVQHASWEQFISDAYWDAELK